MPMVGTSREITCGSCNRTTARSAPTRYPSDRWRMRLSQTPTGPVVSRTRPVGGPSPARIFRRYRAGSRTIAARQVPPQLAALTKDHTDVPRMGIAIRPRVQPAIRTSPEVAEKMPVSTVMSVDSSRRSVLATSPVRRGSTTRSTSTTGSVVVRSGSSRPCSAARGPGLGGRFVVQDMRTAVARIPPPFVSVVATLPVGRPVKILPRHRR